MLRALDEEKITLTFEEEKEEESKTQKTGLFARLTSKI